MITLSTMLLPLAFLTLPEVEFYFNLNADMSISDVSQNDRIIEFEIDTDYILYFETASYPNGMVIEDERIGADLFSIFIDIGEYKISQLNYYSLNMVVSYHKLIVNIDDYTVFFDIDYYLTVIADDGMQWDNYYRISRNIYIPVSDQFNFQQTYELNGSNFNFNFEPRNQNNDIYYEGYEQGMKDQIQSSDIWQLFDAIFNVANNVLSIEILPGIRLWYLIGIPVFFLLLQFILNLFR